MKKTLVVFHGWSLGPSAYKKLQKLLDKDWELIFVPYVQLSAKHGISSISDETSKLLKGKRDIYILGHSLGGALAIDYVSKYPKRVKALFLVNSAGNLYEMPLSAVFRGFIKNNFFYAKNDPVEQFRSFFRVITHLPTQARLGKHAFRSDVTALAKKIDVPTTFLWGEEDFLISKELGQKLHKAIRKARFESLKGEGHDWISYNPIYLVSLLLKTH